MRLLLLFAGYVVNFGKKVQVFQNSQVGRQGKLLGDIAYPLTDVKWLAH